jgi:hypothetical protein
MIVAAPFSFKRATASGGGEEPTAGTVIIGSSALGTNADVYPNADNVYADDTPVAASWAESAETTTLGKIILRGAGWDGGNVKGLLYSSTGSLLATTNVLAVLYGDEANHELVFASPPTITKGTSYILAFIVNTGFALKLNTRTGTGTFDYNSSGTYASPPASIESWTNVAANQIAMWGVK